MHGYAIHLYILVAALIGFLMVFVVGFSLTVDGLWLSAFAAAIVLAGVIALVVRFGATHDGKTD